MVTLPRTPSINADVGESIGILSFGNDTALLEYVDVVNVAGGLHAGDPSGIGRTVWEAVDRGVAVGAHPGLPDIAGFGRRVMSLTPNEVRDLIIYQTGAVSAFAQRAGSELSHIKPHGALFGMLARDEELMEALCDVAEQFNLPVFGIAGSMHEIVAKRRGVPFVSEYYVDLDYDDEGMIIVNRAGSERDLDEVLLRATRALGEHVTISNSGKSVPVRPESFCVHSDLPNAVKVAQAIRRVLDNASSD